MSKAAAKPPVSTECGFANECVRLNCAVPRWSGGEAAGKHGVRRRDLSDSKISTKRIDL